MMVKYGCTRTFGDTTFKCHGYSTPEAAQIAVYRHAFEAGCWRPRALRERWWQFWRPTEHDDIEMLFVDKDGVDGDAGTDHRKGPR